MTPFEEYILKELRKAHQPMSSYLLGDLLGRPQTVISYWLRKLERTGAVARPYGPKSGYVPA